MQPQTKPKSKASVLIVTLMIMGIIVTIALSISLVSLKEKRTSLGSARSTSAYQVADSGIEKVMQLIKDNYAAGTVATIDTDGTCDGIYNSTQGYQVELKDSAGNIISDCASAVSSIVSIKSIGTAGQTQRAIEAAVAVTGGVIKKPGTDNTCVAFYCAHSNQALSCSAPVWSGTEWQASCCGTDTCLSNQSCAWVFCEI